MDMIGYHTLKSLCDAFEEDSKNITLPRNYDTMALKREGKCLLVYYNPDLYGMENPDRVLIKDCELLYDVDDNIVYGIAAPGYYFWLRSKRDLLVKSILAGKSIWPKNRLKLNSLSYRLGFKYDGQYVRIVLLDESLVGFE